MTRSPPQRFVPPPPDPTKQALECLPPEKKVLNVRPHLELNGPRHVPILVSANGIPFLRLGKPQPRNLSRVLRQKMAASVKNFERKVILEKYWEPIARLEDQWDDMVKKLNGVKKEGDKELWVGSVIDARKEEMTKFLDMQQKNREIAAKMQRIVDQEMKLAQKEGVKVVRGRKNKARGGHRPLFP